MSSPGAAAAAWRSHRTGAARACEAGFDRRGGDRKAAREHRAKLEFAARADAVDERGANGVQKLGVADDLEQRPIFAIGRIDIQDFGEGPVTKNNALARVDHASEKVVEHDGLLQVAQARRVG